MKHSTKDSPLTERQKEVYDYLRKRIKSGVVPSVREIGKAVGIASPNGVLAHLNALRKKGWIEREPSQSRSIRLLRELKPGELRDLEGNVHSFVDLFADGNGFFKIDDAFNVYNSGGEWLGHIERIS